MLSVSVVVTSPSGEPASEGAEESSFPSPLRALRLSVVISPSGEPAAGGTGPGPKRGLDQSRWSQTSSSVVATPPAFLFTPQSSKEHASFGCAAEMPLHEYAYGKLQYPMFMLESM